MKVRIFSNKTEVERVAMYMMYETGVAVTKPARILDLYTGPEKSAQESFDIFESLLETFASNPELCFFCNNGAAVNAILGRCHANDIPVSVTIVHGGAIVEYPLDEDGHLTDGWPYGYYEVDDRF